MSAITLVMPLWNGAHHQDQVLPPILRARAQGEIAEVIVVDDGSTDVGAERAFREGFTVLRTQGRRGPAYARNLGVEAAKTPLVLFVDSDVVMHDGVPVLFATAMEHDAGLVAAFGSYDDQPPPLGLISVYRNLWHHWVHQTAPREATTFWAGLGVVRRSEFLAVHGFDAVRYPRPEIEDIELAGRLRARGGRIAIVKDVFGTHLKRWTFWSVLKTDIFQRALPWSRLILSGRGHTDALNLRWQERAKAGLSGVIALALLLTPFRFQFLLVALAALVIAAVANFPFYALVHRRSGALGCAVALVMHQLYYLYGAGVWVFCVLESKLRRPRASA